MEAETKRENDEARAQSRGAQQKYHLTSDMLAQGLGVACGGTTSAAAEQVYQAELERQYLREQEEKIRTQQAS